MIHLPGDKPDASDAPDGEKLGPPGVMPLAKTKHDKAKMIELNDSHPMRGKKKKNERNDSTNWQ